MPGDAKKQGFGEMVRRGRAGKPLRETRPASATGPVQRYREAYSQAPQPLLGRPGALETLQRQGSPEAALGEARFRDVLGQQTRPLYAARRQFQQAGETGANVPQRFGAAAQGAGRALWQRLKPWPETRAAREGRITQAMDEAGVAPRALAAPPERTARAAREPRPRRTPSLMEDWEALLERAGLLEPLAPATPSPPRPPEAKAMTETILGSLLSKALAVRSTGGDPAAVAYVAMELKRVADLSDAQASAIATDALRGDTTLLKALFAKALQEPTGSANDESDTTAHDPREEPTDDDTARIPDAENPLRGEGTVVGQLVTAPKDDEGGDCKCGGTEPGGCTCRRGEGDTEALPSMQPGTLQRDADGGDKAAFGLPPTSGVAGETAARFRGIRAGQRIDRPTEEKAGLGETLAGSETTLGREARRALGSPEREPRDVRKPTAVQAAPQAQKSLRKHDADEDEDDDVDEAGRFGVGLWCNRCGKKVHSCPHIQKQLTKVEKLLWIAKSSNTTGRSHPKHTAANGGRLHPKQLEVMEKLAQLQARRRAGSQEE